MKVATVLAMFMGLGLTCARGPDSPWHDRMLAWNAWQETRAEEYWREQWDRWTPAQRKRELARKAALAELLRRLEAEDAGSAPR